MKVFFIILLIFFITPYLVRWISPFLIKYFFKSMQNKAMAQQEAQAKAYQEEAKAQQQEKKRQLAKDNLGEYVEFEDISEN